MTTREESSSSQGDSDDENDDDFMDPVWIPPKCKKRKRSHVYLIHSNKLREQVNKVGKTRKETREQVNRVTNTGTATQEQVNRVIDKETETQKHVNKVIDTGMVTQEQVNRMIDTGIETREQVDKVINTGIENQEQVNKVIDTRIETQVQVNKVIDTGIENQVQVNKMIDTGKETPAQVDRMIDTGIETQAQVDYNRMIDTGIQTPVQVDRMIYTGIETQVQMDRMIDTGIETLVQVDGMIDTGIETQVQVDRMIETGIETQVQVDRMTGAGIETQVQVDRMTGAGIETLLQVDRMIHTGIETHVQVNRMIDAGIETLVQVDRMIDTEIESRVQVDRMSGIETQVQVNRMIETGIETPVQEEIAIDTGIEAQVQGNRMIDTGIETPVQVNRMMDTETETQEQVNNEGGEISGIDHEEVVVTEVERNISTNKKKENFKLRVTGKPYMSAKKNVDGKRYNIAKSKRVLTASKCPQQCEKQSNDRHCKEIDEATRRSIFHMFWEELNWEEKRVYVLGLVERRPVQRRTTQTDSRRSFSFKYYLRKGDSRIQVCRNMFISKLGINDKMVYNWTQASRKRQKNTKTADVTEGTGEEGAVANGTLVEDIDTIADTETSPRRPNGKEYAKEFLKSLPKVPSHYRRQSTKKDYIEPLFSSICELFREYTRKAQEDDKPVLKRTQFVQVFKGMNLSLFKPKKDLCDVCCGYEAGIIDEDDYSTHTKRKIDARTSKELDKQRTVEGNVKVITIDLQSLLMCPKLNASCLYYRTKLSCHNYTIYDLGTRHVKCYFWHEVDGGLTASVFSSCLVDYLEHLDLTGIDTVVIYSDGCGYQNRNVTLTNALRKFACDNEITVYQKYLEKGHTQMECDSVHSSIERQIRNRPIFVPEQYVEIIKTARKDNPYEVEYVDYTFFRDFSKLGPFTSIRPSQKVGTTTVNEIRQIRYRL